MASKTATEQAKIDEHKERASFITQMINRERQARAWKKIAHVTKEFTPMGVVRLGVPQEFDVTDIKGIWDYLQQPYVEPTWKYITDPRTIENILVQ